MASNFTALWQMAFSWLGSLLRLPLPIYFGETALNMLDIIIGTVGIFVAVASIRALLKSGFTIAGKDLTGQSTVFSRMSNNRRQREYDAVNKEISRGGGSADVSALRKKGVL